MIEIAQNAKKRDIDRAQQEYKDYINLMQMLGRGVGAYKMGKDYRDWKADQALWDDEIGMLDDIEKGYYDPEDLDIDNMASIANRQSIVTPEDYQSLYSLGLID
jgi:hypothetical protein